MLFFTLADSQYSGFLYCLVCAELLSVSVRYIGVRLGSHILLICVWHRHTFLQTLKIIFIINSVNWVLIKTFFFLLREDWERAVGVLGGAWSHWRARETQFKLPDCKDCHQGEDGGRLGVVLCPVGPPEALGHRIVILVKQNPGCRVLSPLPP